MKLNRLVPILWTNDLDGSIAFYRDLLGFECVNRAEGWASLQKDEVELMLSLPNAHEPSTEFSLPAHSISIPTTSRNSGSN